MTAKIIPFPSQGRVRLKPVDDDNENLPVGVRALLAIMEATGCKYGSIMPPKSMTPGEHVRDIAPYLLQPT